MFLDPEPLSRRKKDMSSSSAFFSSPQRPATSARNHPARTGWRKSSLHERSQSENNQQEPNPALAEEPATIRLVNPSPSPESPPRDRGDSDASNKENWHDNPTALPRLPHSAQFKDSVSWPATSAASRQYDVSQPNPLANEVQSLDNASAITLVSDGWQHELPAPVWHRRNTSSGYCSQASTLQDSEIASSKKSRRSERYSSLSLHSTLRGTPTPYEQENRERAEVEASARSGPAQALQTLQESPSERPERLTTIRPVPASDTSSSTDRESGPRSLETSPVRPRTAPSDLEQQPSSNESTPHRSSKRTFSAGSIQPFPTTPNWREATATPATHRQRDGSPESQAISEATSPNPSSPNFIAYTPDSVRPISKKDPLQGATSVESINSRLKYEPIARSNTGRSRSSSGSRASLTPSDDTLPPLHIPKKRLHHEPASDSLGMQAEAQAQEEARARESMEDIDTLPFPKRPFSSHLSTIASDSDSRAPSQHLSHFSLGSGVLTGDDASSLPLSPGHRRQWSAPAESIASGPHSSDTRQSSSSEFQEDVGDMTMGTFREQSAMPPPLFKTNDASGSKSMDAPRKYDGPLPPLPPIPRGRDSDENFDTLSELQAPALHQKRSGYSLRARSNSTPTTHSRQLSQVSCAESERSSHGSALFPTWAKRFYSGTYTLQSKTSFGSLFGAGQRPARHQRGDSAWTDRSITSRLGTGYSNTGSVSPVSSHFLPAIFRTRSNKRSAEHTRHSRDSSNKIRKSGTIRRSRDRPSQDARDSMAIHRDPLPRDSSSEGPKDSAAEILPSGQPRWGALKDPDTPSNPASSPRPHRLPRKYSKQRQWNQMEFPRPMTKDRLSEFDVHEPHLGPSKRSSQNRLDVWHAPSFASSLDTLITSRHNRQILLFVVGFICPLTWMLGAVLPLPKKPMAVEDLEANVGQGATSEEDVQMAMMKHEAGDAEKRWREERAYSKARWWRVLNRVMSVVGIGVLGAVIALAVVATTRP